MSLGLIISASGLAYGQSADFYCGDRELGDQFYCKYETMEAVEEPKPAPAPVVAPPPVPEVKKEDDKDIIKRFDAFKEKLNTARQVAVFTGEPKDIERYMRLQKEAGEMSSKFMKEYQFLGWQDPSLSYATHVPVETFAKNGYRSERRKEVESHIKATKDRYGFFYFYAKNCAACVQFSPIVKALSARHGLVVIPIAQKGQESIEWPGTKPDNGIGERVGLIGNVTPAIVLYDAEQDAAVPISYGVLSLETLENRIYMLTREKGVKYLGGDLDVH